MSSRILTFVTIFTLFLFTMAGTAPAGTQMTIKLGYSDNPEPFSGPATSMADVFKGVLEQETQGQIKVNVFPSWQLGTEREMLELTKLGKVEAVILGEGTTVNFFPPLEVLGIPFLYPNPAEPEPNREYQSQSRWS